VPEMPEVAAPMEVTELEKARQSLISYVDGIKEHVKKAVYIRGEWKTEKPSMRPVFHGIQPVGWEGMGHTRYTLSIDVIDPLILEIEK